MWTKPPGKEIFQLTNIIHWVDLEH